MTNLKNEHNADARLAFEPLVRSLRLLEQDHAPDGYPPVKMGEISALLDEIEAAWADRGPGHTCQDCGSWVKEGWIHGCA